MADIMAMEPTDKNAMAVDDVSARQLHNKATRGETLTEAEQANLTAWYERQDAEENALLVSNASPSTTLRDLRNEVEAASAQMLAVTQHIQTLIAENEALRREIALLTDQLTRTTSVQAI